MRFLIIGTSLTLFGVGCSKENVDFLVKADFIFVNETNYDIKYEESAQVFNVNAHDTTTYSIEGEGPETVGKDSFDAPVHSFCSPCKISFDEIKCDEIQNNGPADLNNYVATKISQRHMSFTYTYTESDFEMANDCK